MYHKNVIRQVISTGSGRSVLAWGEDETAETMQTAELSPETVQIILVPTAAPASKGRPGIKWPKIIIKQFFLNR